jgi:hypothetical protein
MPNETTASNAPKYPLAVDVDGIPLKVPPQAVAWRVRKLAKRAGRPKIIFDTETGRPLELALETPYDDFCDRVGESGRYRLEAIDADGRPIAGCVAVTEVFDDETDTPAIAQTPADALPAALQLIAQLVQSNAKVMEAMASAFGQVHPAQPAMPVVIQQQPSADKTNNTLDAIAQVIEMLTGKKMPPAAASTESGTVPTSNGEE